MDVERLLVSRTLLDKDIVPAVEARITVEWFEDSDGKRVWAWVLKHWTEYGQVPTSGALKAEFPTYKLLKSDDPLPYLIDEMRRRRRFDIMQTNLFEAMEKLQDANDVDEAQRLVAGALTQLGVETAADVDCDLIETWETRVEGYFALRDLPNGLRGIPTGFPTIDRVLSGLQDGQLITFVGLPKAGKSTMVLKMAMAAHEYGKTPLFVGFEMSNTEQEARYDAMLARVDHQALLTGNLTDDELDQLEATLKRRKSMHPFYLSSDITSSQTISGLGGKIEQYQPDLLIVDGVYMMIDEITGEQNTPQSLTNITRSMKRLAQTHDIPIMMTTQALGWKVSRKQGLTSGGIGYSSSFLQDSDVVFGVESVEGADDLKKVSVLDARSAPRIAIIIKWNWATGEFEEEGETEFGDDEGEGSALAVKMGYDK